MGKKKREEEWNPVCGISKQCEPVCSFMPVDIIVEGEERKYDCIKEKKREKKMVRNSKEYRENEKWTTRMERKIKR